MTFGSILTHMKPYLSMKMTFNRFEAELDIEQMNYFMNTRHYINDVQ